MTLVRSRTTLVRTQKSNCWNKQPPARRRPLAQPPSVRASAISIDLLLCVSSIHSSYLEVALSGGSVHRAGVVASPVVTGLRSPLRAGAAGAAVREVQSPL